MNTEEQTKRLQAYNCDGLLWTISDNDTFNWNSYISELAAKQYISDDWIAMTGPFCTHTPILNR